MGFTTGREFHPALRMRAKYNAKYLGTKSEREKYFHLAYNKHTQFLRYQEQIMSKTKEKKSRCHFREILSCTHRSYKYDL